MSDFKMEPYKKYLKVTEREWNDAQACKEWVGKWGTNTLHILESVQTTEMEYLKEPPKEQLAELQSLLARIKKQE